jgi:hypothetical protein
MNAVRAGLVITALSIVSACGGGAVGEMNPGPAPRMGACVPVDGSVAVGASMSGMQGRYRLTMVSSSGSETADGTMRLEARSGALASRGGTATPLSGTADIDLAAVGAQAVRGLDSADFSAPGVLVLESEGSTGPDVLLRFGSEANRTDRQAIDGAFTVLEPRLIEDGGFFGEWRSGVRAERSSGYFCAWPLGA